jgi:Caudovirus prohead serine protease
MRIYGEITKVEAQDDGTIKVFGTASTGAIDDADETVSPDAMKAALPAYMRFGALREMHGLTAAGATLSAEVGEDGATRIAAHVVDPVAVKKVQLGVYKGFSIGGRVLSRDPADRKVITKLKLNEISLVDRPCNPEAVIDMWKAETAEPPAGASGPPNAPTNTEVVARAIDLAAAAGRRGRYRDYVLKAREALLKAGAPDAPGPSLDASAPPSADFTEPGIAPMSEPILRVGARNSAADLDHIQAAHDHLCALGAQCGEDMGGDDEDDADSITMVSRTVFADVDQLWSTIDILQKRLDDLGGAPAPPKALAGAVRAIGKAEDANPSDPSPSPEDLKKYLDGLPQEERARLELMAALRRPIPIGR